MACFWKFRKVTHCIFDNDGLLMDTENIYSDAIQRVLTPFEKTYTFDMKLRCMGLGQLENARLMVEEYELPLTPEQYMKKQEEQVVRLMDHVRLMPGAELLLRHLHQHNVPLAVATSSTRRLFNLKSRAHLNLLPVFQHLVYGCDPELQHGKPAPDIYLLAASRFKPAPKPENCLVFEDSPNGVQAARAAGMQVVMVPDARLPKELTQQATQVLPTLGHFNPIDFGLPSYDACSTFEFG